MLIGAAAGAITLFALVLIARITSYERTPGWAGPVVAIVFIAAVVILLWLKRGRSTAAWVAVVGAGLAVVGSGLTRHRRELRSYEGGGGEIVGRVDTWWPVLVSGLVIGLVAVVVAYRGRDRATDGERFAALSLLTLSFGTAVVVVLMRDIVMGHWIEGRPVRRRGHLVLPPRRVSSGSPTRDAWLAAADHETAAMAAFEDLALRLHGVGAPVELIERCRRAAADETRHARQCLRLAGHGAEARLGTATPPARRSKRATRVDSRRTAVMRIALESFVDGMVNEGFAAARMQRSAARTDAETALQLQRVARDERRHATLAADIVRWCRTESGFLLDAALLVTARRLPAIRPFPVGLRGVEPSTLATAGLGDPSTSAAAWTEARDHARNWIMRESSSRRLYGRHVRHRTLLEVARLWHGAKAPAPRARPAQRVTCGFGKWE